MYYTITNGSVSFGADTILENINFSVKGNEKIAVVGRNGSGKTTLLKSISKEVPLEKGTGEADFSVNVSPDLKVGYLKQITFKDDTATLLDEVLTVFEPIFKAEREMAELLEKIDKESGEEDIKRYSDLLDRYDILGGYTYKKEYSVMIKKFGFTEADTKKKISEFSGGQRTKIAFMKLLLSKPDLLLLDEPTNHLDISAVKWLEDYLKNYKSAVVIVSHDRMFLNRIVSKVYEIEYGETACYSGNYSDFERQKKALYEKRLKDFDAQQKEIARINALIERFRYKATKAKMVQSKIKMLERMKKAEMPNPYNTKTFKSDFSPETENVKEVFSAKGLTIGYEKPLLTVNFDLINGRKLGIIGDNGIGKSTFLKTIMNIVPPLSGEFSFGIKSKLGYFEQTMAEISGEQTVFADFSAEFPSLLDSQCRSALAAFLFTGEDVFKPLNVLSGGERVRLALCKIFKHKPNFLILDEPTNHMDIIGKESLENMLSCFSGTVITVSHDRYFIDKIADCLLIMDSCGCTFFDGTFSEYEQKIAEKKEEPQTPEKKEEPFKKPPTKKGYTTPFKERQKKEKRAAKLETLIEEYTKKGEDIKSALQDPEIYSDYQKVSSLQNELIALSEELENYISEWATLTDELDTVIK